MPASERDAQPQPHGLPGPSGAVGPTHLSMSDLLASCAAASAVSTPPRDPAPVRQLSAEARPAEALTAGDVLTERRRLSG
ncbi:hypothetical protein AB0B50_18655 [Streptomyces sp. NPDC041068]|uniref:hypothetical protein n=1 Tax=Streptomyces sp. NPDC041068 TaxID=3155130 RepID=UPI0033D51F84